MNICKEHMVGSILSVLMTFDSRKIFVLYVILLVLNLQGKMQQKTGWNIYEYNQDFLTKPIYYLQVGQFGDSDI